MRPPTMGILVARASVEYWRFGSSRVRLACGRMEYMRDNEGTALYRRKWSEQHTPHMPPRVIAAPTRRRAQMYRVCCQGSVSHHGLSMLIVYMRHAPPPTLALRALCHTSVHRAPSRFVQCPSHG